MNNFFDFLRMVAADTQLIGARICLIGGLAVSLRAEPRLTRDVDLAVAVENDREAEETTRAMLACNYEVISSLEQKAASRFATVRLGCKSQAAFILDLLFASSGIKKEAVDRAESLEVVPGLFMPVARIPHLIAMKVLSVDEATRPRDAEDLLSLIRVAKTEEMEEARSLLKLIESRGFSRRRDLDAVFADFISRARRT